MTRNRTRPQVEPPASWNNPQPQQPPPPSLERSALQDEVLSVIEDLERHLNTLKNRVDAGAEVGSIFTVKVANLNFALGKYQHSLDIKKGRENAGRNLN